MFQGPVPPPAIIEEYERIYPGAGRRILDDAHDDVVQDRQITQKAFNFTVHEATVRLRLAIGLNGLSFVGIFACLVFFDAPESIVGATLCGLGTVGPGVHAVLTREQKPKSSNPEPTDEATDNQQQLPE